MKNHFDKNGNYINVENLSLAEIYHRGYQDGSEDGLNGIRPQGEWVIKQGEFSWWLICSNCKEVPLTSGLTNQDVLSNFCPNCGADMRGDDHD